MSKSIHNFRYRIKNDMSLTDEEKDILLKDLTEDNCEERFLLRRKMLTSKKKYICKHCKIEFQPALTKKSTVKEFCSDKCCNDYFNITKRVAKVEKICISCGTKFMAHKAVKCRACHRMVLKQCKKCGEDFYGNTGRKICLKCADIPKEIKIKPIKEKVIKVSKPKKIREKKPILTKLEKLKDRHDAKRKALDNTSNLADIIRISREIVDLETKINKLLKEGKCS